MLRVFNNTARYVNQGGGKRKGSFAIYLEPWHADIFDFLDLRKNHGKEEARAWARARARARNSTRRLTACKEARCCIGLRHLLPRRSALDPSRTCAAAAPRRCVCRVAASSTEKALLLACVAARRRATAPFDSRPAPRLAPPRPASPPVSISHSIGTRTHASAALLGCAARAAGAEIIGRGAAAAAAARL
jgi:hypothetical protein